MPPLQQRISKVDYPVHLAAMWQKAIAPRDENAPTVVSTFAGGGGSLTGYMMAGFNDLLAVEWDKNAVETLRLNWPDLDIYHGDIAKISVDDILKRTGLAVGELDILDGSPPCQGFSTAGKRVMDDPRNQLFQEFARLLRGLQPKVFVMENVSGMVKGKMKLLFVDILKELKASGYDVSARLLNAKYFHVPQSRQRLIFIGVRNDLGIKPSHPKAESLEITVREAWRGLPLSTSEECGIEQYAIGREWYKLKQGGKSEKYLSLVKAAMDKPSPVITKMSGQTLSAASVVHPHECRKYSSAEAARIGSFPDLYMFRGWSDALFRIGNSVPPLFMEAIARHIKNEILAKTAVSFIQADTADTQEAATK